MKMGKTAWWVWQFSYFRMTISSRGDNNFKWEGF